MTRGGHRGHRGLLEGVVTAQDVTHIESTSAVDLPDGSATRAEAANLRTTASDSAGNKLSGVTVVYITDDGSLVMN